MRPRMSAARSGLSTNARLSPTVPMSVVCVVMISERSSGIGSRPNTSVKASKIMNTGVKAMAPSSCATAFAGPITMRLWTPSAWSARSAARCAARLTMAPRENSTRPIPSRWAPESYPPTRLRRGAIFPSGPVVATKFHNHLGRLVAGTVPSVCLTDCRYGSARLLLRCAADDLEQRVTPAHQRIARWLGADPVNEECSESIFLHGVPTRTSMAAAGVSNPIAVMPGLRAARYGRPCVGDVGNKIADRHGLQISTLWPLPNLMAQRRPAANSHARIPAHRIRWTKPRIAELPPAKNGGDMSEWDHHYVVWSKSIALGGRVVSLATLRSSMMLSATVGTKR